jgi:hypothetical protein
MLIKHINAILRLLNEIFNITSKQKYYINIFYLCYTFYEGVSAMKRTPKLLAEGTKRKVYDMGDGTIIKVSNNDWGQNGIMANLEEIETYQNYLKIKEEDRIIKLGEIIDYHPNGHWLRMKKYDNKTTNEVIKKFKELMEIILILDFNYANLCQDKDGFVLVDYEGIHWTWFSKKENPYFSKSCS